MRRHTGWLVAWTIALGLVTTSSAQAGWAWLYYSLGNDNAMLDVSMADERVGCAVGAHKPPGSSSSAPLVLCTGDGGQSWRQASLGSGMIVPTAVAMAGVEVGYLATFELAGMSLGSKIYRTADGGRSWTAQALPGSSVGMLGDLVCLDERTCWAAGAGGVFYTLDGSAWQAGSLPALGAGRQVEGLFFLDAQRGFAVGGHPGEKAQNEWEEDTPPCCGFVLETSDGGGTWRIAAEGFAGGLRRVSFVDSTRGWAAGGGTAGLMLATSDSGRTWTPQVLPSGPGGAPTYVADVTFAAADAGYAVANVGDGNPMVLLCEDGHTWRLDATYQDAFAGLTGMDRFVAYAPLIAASFPRKGMGVVSGKHALLVGFQGQGFCPDADGDGHASQACGGDDCDDQNPYVHPGAEELCNGLDEDCDGVADDGIDLDRDPKNCGECGFNCQPAQVCWDGRCTLNCPAGLTRCGQFCADTLVDLAHCGGCDQACEFFQAEAACQEGSCRMGACLPGFVDLDPGEPGCEYPCTPTGPEACNGLDDDCDGLVDEELPGCQAADGGLPDGGQPDGGGGTDSDPAPAGGGCGHVPGGPAGLGWALAALVLGARRLKHG
jgi:photosystem II stability/assembly factor-like uncharacterized protein